ncbi:unnamed protein product [Amoebophrya sp. A25]|nr:unnamed protein product [Amoebophrya sp. A25]|eukprot:GSA25T00014242001.1
MGVVSTRRRAEELRVNRWVAAELDLPWLGYQHGEDDDEQEQEPSSLWSLDAALFCRLLGAPHGHPEEQEAESNPLENVTTQDCEATSRKKCNHQVLMQHSLCFARAANALSLGRVCATDLLQATSDEAGEMKLKIFDKDDKKKKDSHVQSESATNVPSSHSPKQRRSQSGQSVDLDAIPVRCSTPEKENYNGARLTVPSVRFSEAVEKSLSLKSKFAFTMRCAANAQAASTCTTRACSIEPGAGASSGAARGKADEDGEDEASGSGQVPWYVKYCTEDDEKKELVQENGCTKSKAQHQLPDALGDIMQSPQALARWRILAFLRNLMKLGEDANGAAGEYETSVIGGNLVSSKMQSAVANAVPGVSGSGAGQARYQGWWVSEENGHDENELKDLQTEDISGDFADSPSPRQNQTQRTTRTANYNSRRETDFEGLCLCSPSERGRQTTQEPGRQTMQLQSTAESRNLGSFSAESASSGVSPPPNIRLVSLSGAKSTIVGQKRGVNSHCTTSTLHMLRSGPRGTSAFSSILADPRKSQSAMTAFSRIAASTKYAGGAYGPNLGPGSRKFTTRLQQLHQIKQGLSVIGERAEESEKIEKTTSSGSLRPTNSNMKKHAGELYKRAGGQLRANAKAVRFTTIAESIEACPPANASCAALHSEGTQFSSGGPSALPQFSERLARADQRAQKLFVWMNEILVPKENYHEKVAEQLLMGLEVGRNSFTNDERLQAEIADHYNSKTKTNAGGSRKNEGSSVAGSTDAKTHQVRLCQGAGLTSGISEDDPENLREDRLRAAFCEHFAHYQRRVGSLTDLQDGVLLCDLVVKLLFFCSKRPRWTTQRLREDFANVERQNIDEGSSCSNILSHTQRLRNMHMFIRMLRDYCGFPSSALFTLADFPGESTLENASLEKLMTCLNALRHRVERNSLLDSSRSTLVAKGDRVRSLHLNSQFMFTPAGAKVKIPVRCGGIEAWREPDEEQEGDHDASEEDRVASSRLSRSWAPQISARGEHRSSYVDDQHSSKHKASRQYSSPTPPDLRGLALLIRGDRANKSWYSSSREQSREVYAVLSCGVLRLFLREGDWDRWKSSTKSIEDFVGIKNPSYSSSATSNFEKKFREKHEKDLERFLEQKSTVADFCAGAREPDHGSALGAGADSDEVQQGGDSAVAASTDKKSLHTGSAFCSQELEFPILEEIFLDNTVQLSVAEDENGAQVLTVKLLFHDGDLIAPSSGSSPDQGNDGGNETPKEPSSKVSRTSATAFGGSSSSSSKSWGLLKRLFRRRDLSSTPGLSSSAKRAAAAVADKDLVEHDADQGGTTKEVDGPRKSAHQQREDGASQDFHMLRERPHTFFSSFNHVPTIRRSLGGFGKTVRVYHRNKNGTAQRAVHNRSYVEIVINISKMAMGMHNLNQQNESFGNGTGKRGTATADPDALSDDQKRPHQSQKAEDLQFPEKKRLILAHKAHFEDIFACGCGFDMFGDNGNGSVQGSFEGRHSAPSGSSVINSGGFSGTALPLLPRVELTPFAYTMPTVTVPLLEHRNPHEDRLFLDDAAAYSSDDGDDFGIGPERRDAVDLAQQESF